MQVLLQDAELPCEIVVTNIATSNGGRLHPPPQSAYLCKRDFGQVRSPHSHLGGGTNAENFGGIVLLKFIACWKTNVGQLLHILLFVCFDVVDLTTILNICANT